jgi:hypothetical protein
MSMLIWTKKSQRAKHDYKNIFYIDSKQEDMKEEVR